MNHVPRIAVFSSRNYDKEFFSAENSQFHFDLQFFENRLDEKTVKLAAGFDAVVPFVTDHLNAATLRELKALQVKVISLRSAGFNHVDIREANLLGLKVLRVPSYSPHAIAEHTLALILSLNRKIHRAHMRVHEGNFSLEGLMGFDLFQKTVGVIGTGKIGIETAKILKGFGCEVVAFDPQPSSELQKMGVEYLSLNDLFKISEIVTLHCPLTEQTRHLVNKESLQLMKRGVMIINTGRGALIQTKDVIEALKTGQVGYLGIDVYEEEENIFFTDHSSNIIQDDVFARLLTFPNVIITGHQAFFTKEAVTRIAKVTFENISKALQGVLTGNEVEG